MSREKELFSFICGKKGVQEAIENNPNGVDFVWLQKPYETIIKACRDNGVTYEIIKDSDKFFRSKVNKANHQGAMAKIKDFGYVELDDIIANVKGKERPVIIITDGIQDPGNLGAIIRTAEATKVDAIILKNHGNVHVNPLVSKVSTGATQWVPICIVNNVTETMKKLAKNGFWSVGTDVHTEALHWDESQKYDFPVLLVVGNEKSGISRLVLEQCDFKVKIPMMGKVESLNVSVATALMLYQIRNQQK